MISQGSPPPGVSAAAWAAYLNNLGGGGGSGGGAYGNYGTSGGGGGGYNYSPADFANMTEEEFLNYLNSLPSEPYAPYDPYANNPITINGVPQGPSYSYNYGVPGDSDYFRDQPGTHNGTGAPIPGQDTPSGTLYDQLENPGRPGYYHTGGGMGYIHGGPEDEQRAWNLFLDMRRNGWDPYAPGAIEEARRGMGEFTTQEFDRYFEDYLRDQMAKDPKGREGTPDLGNWNDILVSGLGKGKLGKLGLGKWLKNAQEGATFDDWMASLNDNQRQYISDWMVGLGADKNWEDRLRQGDAPWSRGQEAIDRTSRQNPREPIPERDDRPSPGGGPRGPKGGGGDGGEGEEGGYTGPLGLPAYAGLAFSPSFLAYQPGNTTGTIQFVPGRA